MQFQNRLKKEITEGAVKALLIDAGYRVRHAGIERIYPEIEFLSLDEYKSLNLNIEKRLAPDLIVSDKANHFEQIVEVKYRADWSRKFVISLRRQVETTSGCIVVTFWGNAPPHPSYDLLASRFLRCFHVRMQEGGIQIQLLDLESKSWKWFSVESFSEGDFLATWWQTMRLTQAFPLLENKKNSSTLLDTITALSGLLSI